MSEDIVERLDRDAFIESESERSTETARNVGKYWAILGEYKVPYEVRCVLIVEFQRTLFPTSMIELSASGFLNGLAEDDEPHDG